MEDRRDLYLLQDGTHADPADVSADAKGVLRHKNGLLVCLYADGTPQTVGKDAVVNKNVEAATAGTEAAAKQAAADAAARDAAAKQSAADGRPPTDAMISGSPPSDPPAPPKVD
jgi:hypothetical protein